MSPSQKNHGIPSRVLPDPNVPNSESSRIQTRSGTLNNASSGPNPSAKVPETLEESSKSMSTEESGLCENSLKSLKNDECSPDDSMDCKNDSDFDSESSLSESGSDHGNNSEDEQSEWTGTKLTGGKVILRKARLKLDNKTLGGTEGPFSMANAQCAANGNTNSGKFCTCLKCLKSVCLGYCYQGLLNHNIDHLKLLWLLLYVDLRMISALNYAQIIVRRFQINSKLS